jgi:hypothetical protein
MSRFASGKLVVTPGITAALDALTIASLFRRHLSGDFGDLCREDLAANERAIASGERVLSAYVHEGVEVFVITEADRSLTTALLRSEY